MATSIAHARRRSEWIAGRVAAKWLVLEHMSSTVHESPPLFAWPPPVQIVAVGQLETIPPASYRHVEVRRNIDGAPYVVREGVATDTDRLRISIAHCGGWAVAAFSTVGAVGVDVEEVGPRRRGFYEANMTEGERRWITGAPEVAADRIGTLLWVLKEAVLKSGASAARTIWEMSAIDIDVATPAADVAETWPLNEAGCAPTLVTLPVRVSLTRAPRSFTHAAYGAIGNLAISVVAVTSCDLERRSAAPWRAESDSIFQRT